MERSNSCFEEHVVQPLRSVFADIRSVRNYVASSTDLQTQHGGLGESLRKIDDTMWKVVSDTKQIGRRFKCQVTKVKKKMAPTARLTTKPSKSAARQEAGKLKADSLTAWKQDIKTAVAALKEEGYKGSLKFKKGMPVHTKIIELQKARLSGVSSSPGASGSASVVGM